MLEKTSAGHLRSSLGMSIMSCNLSQIGCQSQSELACAARVEMDLVRIVLDRKHTWTKRHQHGHSLRHSGLHHRAHTRISNCGWDYQNEPCPVTFTQRSQLI